MTCKEELILYWQDQVGPDSEEDKARGAAIGALHWDMMQSYERMIERISQIQHFMKQSADAWPALLKQAPALGLSPQFLRAMALRLLEEYKGCRPPNALDFYLNYEEKIKEKQAGCLKHRLSLLFEDPRWLELYHGFVTHPFRKELEESIRKWQNASYQPMKSPEAWIAILENRRKAYAYYGAVFGSSFVTSLYYETLHECVAVRNDEEWMAATETAHQVAAEMLQAMSQF